MKSFPNQRQKRKGNADRLKYHASPTKKTARMIKVVVKQLDPYCLGIYFEREDGSTPFYWPLYSDIEKSEKNWTKDLNIEMVVRRRDKYGGPRAIMKQSTKNTLYWHMFVRFLDNKQLEDSTKIGAEWGEKVAAAMNRYFIQKQREDESKASWVIDKYVFAGVDEMVEKASDCIVQMDMVLVANVLFKDTISTGKLFEEKDLMELLFPGVKSPELFFMDKM